MVLPAWLGVADALVSAVRDGNKAQLRDMYEVRMGAPAPAPASAPVAAGSRAWGSKWITRVLKRWAGSGWGHSCRATRQLLLGGGLGAGAWVLWRGQVLVS